MSAQDYYEPLTIYQEIETPGPMGRKKSYIKEKTINGAVGTLSKQEKLIAEANGIKATYVITTDLTDQLPYDTIIKREKFGQFLRIKSEPADATPPSISSFDWCQVYAEKFEMPRDFKG